MKKFGLQYSLGCIALLLSTMGLAHAQSLQVVGYVFAHGRLLKANEIDPHKITRLQYAFLLPVDGEVNDKLEYDSANLTTLMGLKREAAGLQIVLSIGGGSHSDAFSDIAMTAESRQRFVKSCLSLLEKYGLDGVDIDWEYPAAPHADGSIRPEDKHNYTLLLRDLRVAFDQAEGRLGRHVITSTATNGKAFFLRNTEMGEVSKYVDTINLMGYDFYGHGSATTGNHSALFNDPSDPKPVSDDQCVQAYLAAAVPPGKIVLGVPFYGHGWTGVDALNHGLFRPGLRNSGFDIEYIDLLKDLEPSSGFVRYWDKASAVPWLYNEKSGTFISYDDPESLTDKALYVRTHHLGGMMFWELNGDAGGVLQDAINRGLRRTH